MYHRLNGTFILITALSFSNNDDFSFFRFLKLSNYFYAIFSAEKKSVTAVEGGLARLPCLTSPPNNIRDRIKLVLWFKNDSAIPIYT